MGPKIASGSTNRRFARGIQNPFRNPETLQIMVPAGPMTLSRNEALR